MEEESKKQWRLIKDESIRYKMIVTKSLEDKIRYLCAKFPDNEYSGVLFYTTEGSVGASDFTVKCVDFCLCDIGSSAYTEFETRPEVVTYMCDNDLLGCYMGLLHSHDKMSTFFSGTDTDTLKAEGSSMPHFVSLIVNNEGKYTAAITSKVERVFKGTVTESVYGFENSFKSFEPIVKEFSDSCVKYNFFDITVERDPWYADVDEKISSIKSSKSKSKSDISIYKPGTQLNLWNSDSTLDELPFTTIDDYDLCESIVISTLSKCSGSKKVASSLYDALMSFRNKFANKIPDDIIDKMELTIRKEIKKAGVDTDEMCNSLLEYLDTMSIEYEERMLGKDLSRILDTMFTVIMGIIEK